MGWFYFILGALTLIGIYGIFAMILNMVGGWGGLWDMGSAGLLAVGAYVYVVVTIDPTSYDLGFSPGWPIWAGVLIAAVCTGIVALVVGSPALRVRGEFFLVCTFAFAEVIRQIALVETGVTGGVRGISGIDRPFSDLVGGSDYRYVLLALVAGAALLVFMLMRRLSGSPFVRMLRATRDNEIVALSLGKDVARARIKAFMVAGVLFGLVAPLYVWYIRAVIPDLFVVNLTFVIWVALIVGGLGSVAGGLLGALTIVGLTEILQLLQGSAEYANLLAASRPLLLGVVLIAIVRLRPEGAITERWTFRNASRIAGRST